MTSRICTGRGYCRGRTRPEDADTFGLLCVHPHPDDETIACGGVLARHVDEGLRVKVVTCTYGEEGENLAGIDLGDEEMRVVRERELADALAVLGVREHEYLGYRDSGMAGSPANDHPDSFARADLDEAARRLAATIRTFRPDVVVSDDDRGSYGHPDHIKAHQVTVRAVDIAADASEVVDGLEPWEVSKRYVHALPRTRLAEFHHRMLDMGLASPFGPDPIEDATELPFGTPDAEVTTRVDVTPWYERKRAAMRAHRSQIGEASFFLNLPSEIARQAFGVEHFVLARRDGAADRRAGGTAAGNAEDDLFAGLRSPERSVVR